MDEYTQRYLARSSQRGVRQTEEDAYTQRYLARRNGASQTGKRVDVGVDPYGTGAKPAAEGNTDTKSLPSGN